MSILSSTEINNIAQALVVKTIAMRAPNAVVDADDKRGMHSRIPDLDQDILASSSGRGYDFPLLIDVVRNLGGENLSKEVDHSALAVFFNVIRAAANDENLPSNPLRELPDYIGSIREDMDPIEAIKSPLGKFGDNLRDRKGPISSIEAGASMEHLTNQDMWMIVYAVMELFNNKNIQFYVLTLKAMAQRIGEEKELSNVHDADSIRLLMNIQTVLDGAKDYRK